MNDRGSLRGRIALGAVIGFAVVLIITLGAASALGDGQDGLKVAAIFVSLIVGGGIGALIAARIATPS
jgi:NAD/NADP transhydrogenase beta subunit